MEMRLVVSICGPSGAGKSQLAKALVGVLGEEHAARVPADYFLQPADGPLAEYLRRPLRYDWGELRRALAGPLGTVATTPAFDFVAFRRLPGADARAFVVRPVLVVDAIYPCPGVDLTVLLSLPEAARKARVAERDRVWGTEVAARWAQLEASRAWLEGLPARYDLRLDGERPLVENAGAIARRLAERTGGTPVGRGRWGGAAGPAARSAVTRCRVPPSRKRPFVTHEPGVPGRRGPLGGAGVPQ